MLLDLYILLGFFVLPGYGLKQYQGWSYSYVSKHCSSSEVSVLSLDGDE